MTSLSLEDSLEVRETMPERILPSCFHLGKKPVDGVDAKEEPEFSLRVKHREVDGSSWVSIIQTSWHWRP